MKKIMYISITLLLVSFYSCKKDKKIPLKGRVNFVSGEVHIINHTNKKTADVGDVITQDMKIITGNRSFANIYFGNKVIKIISKSTMVISSLFKKGTGEHISLALNSGEVFMNIKKKLGKSDDFRITTTTVVAATRGTQYLVSTSGNRSTIACLHGRVETFDPNKKNVESVSVNAGDELNAEKGKKFTVKPMSDETRKRLMALSGQLKREHADSKRNIIPDKSKSMKPKKPMKGIFK